MLLLVLLLVCLSLLSSLSLRRSNHHLTSEFLVKRAFGVNHMPIGIAIERLKEVEGGMESIGLTNDDAAALNEFYYNVSDVQVHQNGRKMPNISHISPFYRSLVQRLVSKYQSI